MTRSPQIEIAKQPEVFLNDGLMAFRCSLPSKIYANNIILQTCIFFTKRVRRGRFHKEFGLVLTLGLVLGDIYKLHG